MPTASITGLYAAALALLIVGLMMRVVLLRWRFRVGIGTGDQSVLARAIRAHGNAVETVPLALLLMLFVELGPMEPVWLHGAGAALLVGRLAHAFGLSRHAGTSVGRFAGTVLTVGVILYCAGVLVGRALSTY
jgi:uncharacterized protein